MIQFFYDSSPGEKEKWFQNVIRHVYNSHSSNADMSLRDLNKITIDFMLEMLQKAQIRSVETPSQQQPQRSVETHSLPQSHQQQQPQQLRSLEPPSLQTKPKQVQTDAIENQFAIRRQEYENMTKKSVPVPSFTENVKDEAISDIGSVVNEYMKQREQDMKQFIAEKPNNNNNNNNNNKLKIINEENIAINVEELESPLSLPINKKVKWGENTEHVYENIPLPIENLGERLLDAINKLSEKIDKLTADNNELLKKLVKE